MCRETFPGNGALESKDRTDNHRITTVQTQQHLYCVFILELHGQVPRGETKPETESTVSASATLLLPINQLFKAFSYIKSASKISTAFPTKNGQTTFYYYSYICVKLETQFFPRILNFTLWIIYGKKRL